MGKQNRAGAAGAASPGKLLMGSLLAGSDVRRDLGETDGAAAVLPETALLHEFDAFEAFEDAAFGTDGGSA